MNGGRRAMTCVSSWGTDKITPNASDCARTVLSTGQRPAFSAVGREAPGAASPKFYLGLSRLPKSKRHLRAGASLSSQPCCLRVQRRRLLHATQELAATAARAAPEPPSSQGCCLGPLGAAGSSLPLSNHEPRKPRKQPETPAAASFDQVAAVEAKGEGALVASSGGRLRRPRDQRGVAHRGMSSRGRIARHCRATAKQPSSQSPASLRGPGCRRACRPASGQKQRGSGAWRGPMLTLMVGASARV